LNINLALYVFCLLIINILEVVWRLNVYIGIACESSILQQEGTARSMEDLKRLNDQVFDRIYLTLDLQVIGWSA